tara:strand:+ start:7393 stop:8094 length:702 start_codon:yes stop_codon:yes gene_type:complete
MSDHRTQDINIFYAHLSRLSSADGGVRTLAMCNGRMVWPQRGVYFFQEIGEGRSSSGEGPRIVRVGTHALKGGSKTSIWNRLSQHRGSARSGGGNHRGSIFRLIVGTALMARDGYACGTWGHESSAPRDIRQAEHELEKHVSQVIGAMPFLWLDIDDESGPDSQRGYIERNSIALLSNSGKEACDLPSESWLGRFCDRERVRRSGLWNQNHVDEQYDPAFLDVLGQLIDKMSR